jgi:hypothetical protein
MSVSSSSAATAGPSSAPSSASSEHDFTLICVPVFNDKDGTDSGTPPFSVVISAICVEGGRDIIGSIQSWIERFVDEFARAFMETHDSESIEETFLYCVVSLFNEWPMIEARAKSLYEGVRFSAKLIRAEECASDTENIHEDDEGTRAREASVAGSNLDSATYGEKGKQRTESPAGSNSESEEKPTYKGKGKQCADAIPEEDQELNGDIYKASVGGSKVDSEEEPLAYNGKGKQRAAGPRED